MAEPARKTPTHALGAPDSYDPEPEEIEHGESRLLRWVEGPDGRMELWETPLTPELYLNPQLEDKWLQGRPHGAAIQHLLGLLTTWFHDDPNVTITWDLQHRIGFAAPCPDISLIRKPRAQTDQLLSYNLAREKVPPFLIFEVISPQSARIRRVDEVDKVWMYERIGVQEYVLIDIPRERNGHRFGFHGYRRDETGHFVPMEPDSQGRLLCETLGLWLQVSENGDRVLLVNAKAGEVLRTAIEELEARKAAEDAWRAEADARKAADAENARLRQELERLRRRGS